MFKIANTQSPPLTVREAPQEAADTIAAEMQTNDPDLNIAEAQKAAQALVAKGEKTKRDTVEDRGVALTVTTD